MSTLHLIDPVAIRLGPLAVHWYGLMYLIAFFIGWWLGRMRLRAGRLPVSEQAYSDLIFWAMLGVILGGRVGYLLFYGMPHVVADPMYALRIWEGGMSFHGGLLGVLLALALWSRKHRLHFFDTVDFIAPLVPPGLFLGRIGNFIGGELWGRQTEASWGVVFVDALPPDLSGLPHEALQQLHASGALEAYARHPSQLYQAALEGLMMFIVLWWFSRRPRPRYAVSGLFALLYGVFRFAVEFVREPDAHLGYLAWGWLTMGQVLSLPLIAVGLWLLWCARRAPTRVRAERNADERLS